jgi:hypothetical protein
MRIPAPLARFRVHDQQKSANATKAAAEMRAIVRRALALDPPISDVARERITAQLDYDEYQLTPGPKPGFATALLRNPEWLRAPAVRQRLLGSFRRGI